MDIFIRAANCEVGVGPELVDDPEAVVAVEDDSAILLLGFGDDPVEIGENLSGCKIDDAENEEI